MESPRVDSTPDLIVSLHLGFRRFHPCHYPKFYRGNPSPTLIGKGNVIEIFDAAADQWERAILDDHTVILNFGWAPIGGGHHTLIHQGGHPNREA